MLTERNTKRIDHRLPRPRLRSGRRLAPIALPLSLLIAIGCSSSEEPEVFEFVSSGTQVQQTRDNLAMAMEIFRDLDEYEPRVAGDKILFELNQWADGYKADGSWSRDPLLERIPSRYQRLPELQALTRMEYSAADISYLHGVMMQNDLAERIQESRGTVDFHFLIQDATEELSDDELTQFELAEDQLANALVVLDPELPEGEAQKLATCLRLFDWIIRNTQQAKLLPRPEQQVVGPQDRDAAGDNIWQPLANPGPGYRHYPWQVLLYGRGDAWERGRLLIQLARQDGIEVIMLGTDETNRTSTAVPWLPAAIIHNQLYLFDTQLGLPIPGASGKGIATLEQVKQDPDLLRQLDAKKGRELFRYPVTADELTQVVGLIDASPDALSLRMHAIEQRLTGDEKLHLTIQPSPLEKQIRNEYGINVGLWTIPFDNVVHRRLLAERTKHDLAEFRRILKTEAPYQGNQTLAIARRMHFRGILDNIEDEMTMGAKGLYLDSRMPTAMLNHLSTDEDLQKQLGLFRNPDEDPADWQVRVDQIQSIYRTARVDAALFLALAHYENGDYGDCLTWIDRSEKVDTENVWRDARHYNEARAHEAMRNLREAAIMYRTDRSPQEHGNLLRAEALEKKMQQLTVGRTSQSVAADRPD